MDRKKNKMTLLLVSLGVVFALMFVGFFTAYIIFTATKTSLQTATAGTIDINNIPPQKKKGLSLYSNRIVDVLNPEKILNVKAYDRYVVVGESMLLCGIESDDVVLSLRNYKLVEADLPCVLVLKRDLKRPSAPLSQKIRKKEPLNKLRRTWRACTMDLTDDQFRKLLCEIIQSEEFGDLKAHHDLFNEDEAVKDFFEKRLATYKTDYKECMQPNDENYKAIISTTLHTQEGKIRFSIHPERIITGKVVYAYSNKLVG